MFKQALSTVGKHMLGGAAVGGALGGLGRHMSDRRIKKHGTDDEKKELASIKRKHPISSSTAGGAIAGSVAGAYLGGVLSFPKALAASGGGPKPRPPSKRHRPKWMNVIEGGETTKLSSLLPSFVDELTEINSASPS